LLSGYGTITANVILEGRMKVGGEVMTGVLTIVGNYTQMATGVVEIELGGTVPGTGYDQLNIWGVATLGGQLTASALPGFTPAPGDIFDVVTYASHVGQFDSYSGPGPVGYLPTSFRIGPIP